MAFGIEGTATAAAVSIAALNVVRLVQVRRRVGIQPYDRSYLGLLAPVAAATLAAFGAHAALAGSPWWVSLAVTALAGLAGYCAVLPLVLPGNERAAIATALARIAGQRSPGGLPPVP